MLQSKDIKNLSELTLSFCSKHKKSKFFTDFVSVLKLGKLHASFSSVKQKRVYSLLLIEILLSFPFLDQNNVHRFVNSNWNTELSSNFNTTVEIYQIRWSIDLER